MDYDPLMPFLRRLSVLVHLTTAAACTCTFFFQREFFNRTYEYYYRVEEASVSVNSSPVVTFNQYLMKLFETVFLTSSFPSVFKRKR